MGGDFPGGVAWKAQRLAGGVVLPVPRQPIIVEYAVGGVDRRTRDGNEYNEILRSDNLVYGQAQLSYRMKPIPKSMEQ
jgi:hypothetical protein